MYLLFVLWVSSLYVKYRERRYMEPISSAGLLLAIKISSFRRNSWPTDLSAEGHVTIQCVFQTYTTWKLIGIRHREEIIFKNRWKKPWTSSTGWKSDGCKKAYGNHPRATFGHSPPPHQSAWIPNCSHFSLLCHGSLGKIKGVRLRRPKDADNIKNFSAKPYPPFRGSRA